MSYLILTPHNLNGMNFDHLTPPGKRLWRVGKGVVSAFGMNASQGEALQSLGPNPEVQAHVGE